MIGSRLTIRALVFIGVLCSGIVVACSGRQAESTLPRIATGWSPWRGRPTERFDMVQADPGTLMMRQTNANHQDLLLTCREGAVQGMLKNGGGWVNTGEVKQFPVYRYQPERNLLDEVSKDTWDRASGDIVECDYYVPGESNLLVDSHANQLLFNRRRIPTAAPIAVRVRPSRDGRFAAVLSGEERSRGLMPFFSGGDARGQHYHQILDLATGKFRGGATPIPLISEGGLQCCWSPDDRYIVYYSGADLLIVPFDASPEM